jgi:predicted Zn finger-like uncharacterized protein
MFTRCTQCDAVFRVTLAQLQACSGQVRCGVCRTVFDAFVHLSAIDPRDDEDETTGQPTRADAATPVAPAVAADPETPPAAPTPPSARASNARASTTDNGWPADFLVIPSAVDEEEEAVGQSPASPPELGAAWDMAARTPAPPPQKPEADWLDAAAALPPPPPGDVSADKALLHDMQARARRRRQGWSRVGLALLVLAVPLQLFVFFREDLAMHWPASRASLESVCQRFGCTVALPRIPDSMVLESYELQALDPGRPNRAVLIVAMRNSADVVQAYPSMRLTLTDAASQVAAERVIEPEEYLPTEGQVAAGLAGGAVGDIRVQLDTTTVRPAGFHIYLFHR